MAQCWITAREGAKILEVNVNSFLDLAGPAWKIRFRELPGFPRRYYRPDIIRLAAECVMNGPAPEREGRT